jgi:hypothetical protein
MHLLNNAFIMCAMHCWTSFNDKMFSFQLSSCSRELKEVTQSQVRRLGRMFRHKDPFLH